MFNFNFLWNNQCFYSIYRKEHSSTKNCIDEDFHDTQCIRSVQNHGDITEKKFFFKKKNSIVLNKFHALTSYVLFVQYGV